MKQIPLSRELIALVDDEDFEKVSKYKWSATSSINGVIYGARGIGGRKNHKTIYLHQFIMGMKNVDHRDGDGLNCQRSNLRPATSTQSNRNKCRHGAAPFKGVGLEHRTPPLKKPYRAAIVVNKRRIRLGYFEKAELAASAYDNAARTYFGEFARLNFPKEGEIRA